MEIKYVLLVNNQRTDQMSNDDLLNNIEALQKARKRLGRLPFKNEAVKQMRTDYQAAIIDLTELLKAPE